MDLVMDNDDLRRFREDWKAELNRLHDDDDGDRRPPGESNEKVNYTSTSLNHKDVTSKKDKGCFCNLNSNEATLGSPMTHRSESVCSENVNRTYKRKKPLIDAFKTEDKKRKGVTNLETVRKGKSLIEQLISDINEISAIPFFDQELPREIAINIFMYLGIVDLCHCAQVNSMWKILAEDELLWHTLACRLGFIRSEDIKTVEKSNWKYWVRECVLRKNRLRKNWKERICSLDVLDFERGGSLCAVAVSGDVICAGYSNAQVRLWDWNPEKPRGRILESQACNATNAYDKQLTSLTVEGEICAAGFGNGDVSVWHTGLDNPLKHHLKLERRVKSVALATDEKIAVIAVSDHKLRVDTASSMGQWSCFCQKTFEEKIENMKLLQSCSDVPGVSIVLATVDSILIHTPGQVLDTITLDQILSGRITCIDCRPDLLAVSVAPYGYCVLGNKVRLYCPRTERQVAVLSGHHREITCLNLCDSPPNSLCTGSFDQNVRIYDLRTEKIVHLLRGHDAVVTTVQMSDQQSVSGSVNGTVRVWDLRMRSQLWSTSARHPVRFCKFTDTRLITANMPDEKNLRQNVWWADDLILHRRHRGVIRVFDFTADNSSVGIPDICFSNYDDTSGYNYNINLTVPYDDIIDVYDGHCSQSNTGQYQKN